MCARIVELSSAVSKTPWVYIRVTLVAKNLFIYYIVYVSGRRGGPQGGPMGPPGSDGWNMVGGQSRTPFKSIDRSIDPTKMKISKVTYGKGLKRVRQY